MNDAQAAERSSRTRPSRIAGWLLLIGGTVGPLLDGLHTFSGATWYATPGPLESVWIALWLPPLYFVAAIAIGTLARWLARAQ